MAHPKSRVSKARKNKRRTHHKAVMPQLTVCKATGETHMMHRAYWHEGNMYYKGQLVIEGKSAEAEE